MKTLLILGIIGTILFTACAGHSGMSHPQVRSEEQFIAEMIPHHQEAVESSKIILASTEDDEVKDLAQRIIDAQEQEIAEMKQWQKEWYPGSTYRATYQPMMGDLSQASDKDRAYLEGMIAHHAAAIQMAKQAREYELRPQVRQLTDAIITTQQSEITEMELIAERLS